MRYLSTDLFRRRSASRPTESGTRDDASLNPERFRHPHLPQLYYAAKNQRWPEVRRRANSHPHEVFVQEDISGSSPLHVACIHNPPIEVVKCLLRCANIKNTEGATPLHVAASHRCSADVIRALIEDVPENDGGDDGGKREHATQALTRIGRAPIHYAAASFRGLGIDAFKVLLEATIKAPCATDENQGDDIDFDDMSLMSKEDDEENVSAVNTMTLRDGTGQTALGLLFRRYRERVRIVTRMVETNVAGGNGNRLDERNTTAAHAVQADLGELWVKARLIVSTMAEHHLKNDDIASDNSICEFTSPAETAAAMEAAAWAASRHQGQLQEYGDYPNKVGGKSFRIVHASVGLTGYGCPPEMIRLAISVHPNQVREMDEEGRLPIHIAATAAGSFASSSDSGKSDQTTTADDESIATYNTFMSSFSQGDIKNPFDQVIRILLKHYPESARIPHGKNGRLPFTLAVDAGRRTWNDGLKALFKSYPAALESRDGMDPKLYPAIFALIGKTDEKEKETRRIFPRRNIQRRQNSKDFVAITSVYEVVRARPNICFASSTN